MTGNDGHNAPALGGTGRYELRDRFAAPEGQVYLTGIDALVRLPLDQARRDRAAGHRTEGFVSGYRGSPLGAYDLGLWRAREFLDAEGIRFQPGVNEDLAATAVWGTQQASLMERPRVDGVFAIWYGKGPGVDRSSDALKHGNFAGTSPLGGVLVVAGDDPGAKSSSLAHQSDYALIHCGIPILSPADVQEVLDFGLYGWAMSRYAGVWVGLRCVTDVVESAGSVVVGPGRTPVVEPDAGGRPSIVWSAPPLEMERSLFEQRLPAAQAFARANGLDRVACDAPARRLGIVSTGKAYLDLRQALEEIGIDEERAADVGLSIYKVGMTWPLEPAGLRRFAQGLDEVFVVEEKRPILEEQAAAALYDEAERPRLVGKRDPSGAVLLPSVGELSPAVIGDGLLTWLSRVAPGTVAPPRKVIPLSSSPLVRRAAFCAGCPHNSSTVVPDGSIALGGIGCHGMVVAMPERNTLAYTHMGGEGANWIGISPFTETEHIFQNLGDGTYFHSGLLAIRACVAAGVNITYKVLANGAVAMTGGQPIEGESIDAEVLVPDIVRQLVAERVARVVVVSDKPGMYRRGDLPAGVDVVHRKRLDEVQRALRETKGVSAIVYDQTCAAEARRLRKRNQFPDPDQRVVINELVCEGCGDCSVQSNCIAIEPVETDFGRKRAINQHACNKDFSCLNGYCPSFAIVKGGTLRKPAISASADVETLVRSLPRPAVAPTTSPCNVLVAGVGGSGVVTVGALLGMAAHLEGKACSVLDVTGLAQKNGAVTSHIRVASSADGINSRRIGRSTADLLIGCDVVVSAEPNNLGAMAPDRTRAVLNLDVVPTADFASHPDLDLSAERLLRPIVERIGADAAVGIDARELAVRLVGDELATNLFLVGVALQRGLLPVGVDALERAIELNGVGVEMNKRALAWGRVAGDDLQAALRAASSGTSALPVDVAVDVGGDVARLVDRRAAFLTSYQNAAYAATYRSFVQRVIERERAVTDCTDLSAAVARYLFKLMAYKDEYEVARLYTDGTFSSQVSELFDGDVTVKLHLAPQRFLRADRRTGRIPKRTFGPWIFPAFRVLAKLKFVRGTAFDLFGKTAHRRTERALIAEYRADIEGALAHLSSETYEAAVELARLPEQIRGFGVVKDASIAAARQSRAALTERVDQGTTTVA